MSIPILLATLLTVCPGPQDPSDGDSLAVRVQAGAKITRSFSVETETELLEQRQTQNGQEPPPGMTPQTTRTGASSTSWTAVDVIESAEDGIATGFLRSYEAIEGETSFSMSMDAGGFGEDFSSARDSTLVSRLVDGTVRFEASDEGLVASLPEGSDLEQEDIQGLTADLDLAFLLPAQAVREDDTWEAGGEALQRIRSLAGDLLLVPEGAADGGRERRPGMILMEPGSDEEAEPAVEGALTMTHLGYREVDGRKLIVVGVKVDVTESVSFSPDLTDTGDGELPRGALTPSEMNITRESASTGEGELLFDPAAGIVVSLEVSLEVEATSTNETVIDIPGMGEMKVESTDVEGETVAIAYSATVG